MPSQKYLFLHRSSTDQQPPSPARMQEMFAVWQAWMEKFKSRVVDMGGKLKPSGARAPIRSMARRLIRSHIFGPASRRLEVRISSMVGGTGSGGKD